MRERKEEVYIHTSIASTQLKLNILIVYIISLLLNSYYAAGRDGYLHPLQCRLHLPLSLTSGGRRGRLIDPDSDTVPAKNSQLIQGPVVVVVFLLAMILHLGLDGLMQTHENQLNDSLSHSIERGDAYSYLLPSPKKVLLLFVR